MASAHSFGDLEGVALFAGEERLIARAVDARRRAFATGRACARRALAALGARPVEIGADRRGAPLWPGDVVGSITHCDGYRASAVAWRRDVASVGIDAEPADDGLPRGVLKRIASGRERAALDSLSAVRPGVPWDRLLFSAKESVYKAWYPLTGRWLGFLDAHVTLRVDGSFDALLLLAGPLVDGRRRQAFAGRWLLRDGLLATAVTVGRAPSDSSRSGASV